MTMKARNEDWHDAVVSVVLGFVLNMILFVGVIAAVWWLVSYSLGAQ